MSEPLTEHDQRIMRTVDALQPNAYGLPIRQCLEAELGRSLSQAWLYVALDRLVNAGHLISWEGDPTPERGNRPKRFYARAITLRLTPAELELLLCWGAGVDGEVGLNPAEREMLDKLTALDLKGGE